MNGKSLEDEIILSLLTSNDAEEAEPAVDETAEAETLRRLYTEVLGLLPLAIPPVEPRPELKERLLASIVADAPPSPPTAPLAPLLSFRPSDVVFPHEAAPPAVEVAVSHQDEPPAIESPKVGRRLWPLGLAAGIALVTVSGLVMSFQRDLERADRRVVDLEERLSTSTIRERELAGRLATLEQDHSQLAQRLSMMTEVGATACALRPEAQGPALARGILYVAADHQHWYLKVAGLPTPGPGRTYQLWFLTDSGAVSGGEFETNATATAELGSPTMPDGIRGIAITLEPKSGVSQPTGPKVLAGDEVMALL